MIPFFRAKLSVVLHTSLKLYLIFNTRSRQQILLQLKTFTSSFDPTPKTVERVTVAYRELFLKVCPSLQPATMASSSILLKMFIPRQLPVAHVSEHILHSREPLHGNCFISKFPNSKIFLPSRTYMLPSCIKAYLKSSALLIYPSVLLAVGLEVLGREMKALIQGARNLRQLGIEELGLPLPKLIVVGDQSTGKSSLIEGIRSAIGFPQ